MSIFQNPKAFTLRATGLAKVLTTPLDIFIPSTSTFVRVSGIWDTGATGTAITETLVKQLGLQPTGKTRVNTANGVVLQNTYTIDIGLPNSVKVQGIVANGCSDLPSDNEVLVGMDIIGLGDLSVTNYKGKTCMSFRIPSIHEIDYSLNTKLIVNREQPKTTNVKVGRNDKCPCGSGKKFKKCCGSNN